MKPIRELVQPHLRELQPYTPGQQPSGDGWIKLNTNELPCEPPRVVRDAIAAATAGLARYPDPKSGELRRALARLNGLGEERVLIGNGSDDILNLLARAFGGRGRVTVDTFPSYSLYPVVTAVAGGRVESVCFTRDFTLPVKEICSMEADLLFLTCPNAPTGIRFPVDELRAVAAGTPGILVIDEAYVEFAQSSALPLLEEFDHLVLTRTFSKAFGLAGLRVGYAMASPMIIEVLDRIRDSYNVSRLSQAGALAALQAREFYADRIREVIATREWVASALRRLDWEVLPSEANFLFASPRDAKGNRGAETAKNLYETLLQRKILVRYFPSHPLTASHLRISIGSRLEMERFIQEAEKWQKGE
ncbi:MAG: histidinol-phosphate transaminase [Oceanipulchritudo sp.]